MLCIQSGNWNCMVCKAKLTGAPGNHFTTSEHKEKAISSYYGVDGKKLICRGKKCPVTKSSYHCTLKPRSRVEARMCKGCGRIRIRSQIWHNLLENVNSFSDIADNCVAQELAPSEYAVSIKESTPQEQYSVYQEGDEEVLQYQTACPEGSEGPIAQKETRYLEEVESIVGMDVDENANESLGASSLDNTPIDATIDTTGDATTTLLLTGSPGREEVPMQGWGELKNTERDAREKESSLRKREEEMNRREEAMRSRENAMRRREEAIQKTKESDFCNPKGFLELWMRFA